MQHFTQACLEPQAVELQGFNPLQTARASAFMGWALMRLRVHGASCSWEGANLKENVRATW